MADTKEKSNAPIQEQIKAASETTVDKVDQNSPAFLEAAQSNPNTQMQAEIGKTVGQGENLYFFPDLQKSVVAKSFDEALKQVQSELDALKNEGNK